MPVLYGREVTCVKAAQLCPGANRLLLNDWLATKAVWQATAK